MPTLDLPVRYFQDSTPDGVPCREEHFIRREVGMALPLEQTALVLVDLWDNHFIESWLERATRVTREGVVPVIEAARRAGLQVGGRLPERELRPRVVAHYAAHHARRGPASRPRSPPRRARSRSGGTRKRRVSWR